MAAAAVGTPPDPSETGPGAPSSPDAAEPDAGAPRMTAAVLRERPDLVAAFRAARAWGVAPTAFLGASTWVRTSYAYDQLGRVCDVHTEQPGWTDNDRDAAFALAELEAGLCAGCGHDLAVTQARENEFAWDVDVAMCHACAAAGRAAEQFTGQPGAGAITYVPRFRPERARPDLAQPPAAESG